ncbi:hypothetical protein JOF48_000847 [Arthrobacter stackebrandtii]|uniref:Uncharacterized protein n=1 Tax=Arthrobacter stackebrandtii TaxID=272161 RepID=A0ABS4YVS1_9MICC|nr:hypothetical protein [Arthrobacter stackebrandtii]
MKTSCGTPLRHHPFTDISPQPTAAARSHFDQFLWQKHPDLPRSFRYKKSLHTSGIQGLGVDFEHVAD